MKWKIRFRKRFVLKGKYRAMTANNEPCVIGTVKEIEDFFSQVLAEERKRWVEKVEKCKIYKVISDCEPLPRGIRVISLEELLKKLNSLI